MLLFCVYFSFIFFEQYGNIILGEPTMGCQQRSEVDSKLGIGKLYQLNRKGEWEMVNQFSLDLRFGSWRIFLK